MSLCRPETKLVSQFQLVPRHLCYWELVLGMEAGERALFPTQSPQSFPRDWGRIGYGFWDGEVEEKEQFSKGGSEDRKKKKKKE